MKRTSNDTISDVYKFNDPKLLRHPTNYQPGKNIACYYDKTWYLGVTLERSDKNQDVKVKFMSRKGLHLQWINDAQSIQDWVAFAKVICEISPPKAKAQSARDYVEDQWRIITRFFLWRIITRFYTYTVVIERKVLLLFFRKCFAIMKSRNIRKLGYLTNFAFHLRKPTKKTLLEF